MNQAMDYIEEDLGVEPDDDAFSVEEYLDALEAIGEEDDWDEWEDEAWDDEAFDADALAERRSRRSSGRRGRYPRYRRKYLGSSRTVSRPRPYRPVRATRGGYIRTPGGRQASVRFPKPVATQSSVNARIKELKSEIGKNALAISKVDKSQDKNTAVIDKKIEAINRDVRSRIGKVQQSALLPLLLQTQPELESIELQLEGDGDKKTFKVLDSTFKKQDNLLLPILLLGGLGGDESSGMGSNLLTLLALTGGLGGAK